MEFKILIILFIFGEKVNCFNFDTDFPIVFKEPVSGNGRSYFGYSLAMYPGNNKTNKWFRIGAPKANDTHNQHISEPGVVYECHIMIGCTQMKFPYPKSEFAVITDVWNHSFIGGSMDISYFKETEKHAVCGFRHYAFQKFGVTDYRSLGSCFWSLLNSTVYQAISPLLNFDKAIGNFKSGSKIYSVYLYGQGEAGFSVHFPERQNELILGAPGIYNWAGTPFRVKDYFYSNPEPSKRRRDADIFKTVEVPDATKNEAYNLFGYSVTSGYYYGQDTLYYAAGSPKATTYKGQVVIFTFGKPNTIINKREHKVGQEFGGYFGASLASGKINDDDYDDLLVGAPYFRGKSYNEGQVYIFLGDKDHLTMPSIITGQNKGGQFGAAIMYLGDINRDGFGDVAIGSPFENENSGAIYIYKGTREGLEIEPAQKIIGKDISSNILGFGVTISKAVDMDENGYEDICVGAHLSRNAVLLRSRPLVIIRYQFSSTPKILSPTTRNFTLDICFSYQLFREDNSVNLTYHVTVDKFLARANIQRNSTVSKNITIFSYSQPLCEKINVNIHNSPDLDIKTPLKVSVSYALNYPVYEKSVTFVSREVKVVGNDDTLCIRCPVLDEYKSNRTFYETEIPFTLNCGEDNECESFLNVTITFPNLSENALVLGSSNYIKLQATVENVNENAYSTKIYIVLPARVYFRQNPSTCKSENSSAILCNVANPLKKNEVKQLHFDIEVKDIHKEFLKDHIDIYSRVITSSNNTNNDSQVTSLKLKKEADITIYGEIQQETNYYGNSSTNSSRLTHKYKIEKFGVSAVEKLRVKIQVPLRYEVKNKLFTFLDLYEIDAYFGGQPFSCETKNVNIKKKVKPVYLDENVGRRRRNVDVEVFKNISAKQNEELKINNKDIDISKKTLFLNCTTPGVTCFDVVCTFGPYDKETSPASILIDVLVNVSLIAEFAETVDMVLISSNGQVFIDLPKDFKQNGNREDFVVISSIFINDITKTGAVALWIIIVAVIIGLMLLLILILVFIKIGFFKRTKKHELENLKEAAKQEDKIMENIEATLAQEQENREMENLEPPFPEKMNSSKEELHDEKSD